MRLLSRFASPFGALPLLLTVSGCSFLVGGEDDAPRACTEEFRTYTVQVVDAQGMPLEGLKTTARVLRTGAVLAADPTVHPTGEGRYLVASDADREAIRREGDAVQFTAEGAAHRAGAVFSFYDDGCHVAKRAGPDQVVAEPVGD